MALYDEITNSLDDDKTLIDVLKLSFDSKGLYYALTHDKNYDSNTHDKYYDNFLEYIKTPARRYLYDRLQEYLAKDVDKVIDQKIEDYKKTHNTSEVEFETAHYEKHYLYPLAQYKKILNKFKTFTELTDYLDNICTESIIDDLDNFWYYHTDEQKNKLKEEVKQKAKISDDEFETLLLAYTMYHKLANAFNGGGFIMGFHINPYNLDPANYYKNNIDFDTDIKFYVNIGVDSYQFANIFQKKCEERHLNYMYKVVDAQRREDKRIDRICIWASYENAEEFISILKEIKQEHPEFDYQNPPILCGRINNFIGVGQDFDSSFNDSMSMIIENAVKTIFGDKKLDEILDIISKNPNKLNEFRNEIKKSAKEKGLDTTKMCVRNDAKDRLPRHNKTTNNIDYVLLNNNLYINRNNYDLAKKNNIKVDGTPIIINNRNYYRITKEQLNDLDNSINNTNTNTNTNTSKKNIIIIYNDKISNKKYIKEKDLGYKKNNPKTIMGNTCYEISDEELNKLNKQIVSVSIYLKQKKSLKITVVSLDNVLYIPDKYCNKNNKKLIKVDGVLYSSVTENELAILKQELSKKDIELILVKKKVAKKKDTSNEFIPGTNIPKPRNRGLYETDEEYERFLKEYYDKVFNKKNELNDMFKNNTNEETKEKNI